MKLVVFTLLSCLLLILSCKDAPKTIDGSEINIQSKEIIYCMENKEIKLDANKQKEAKLILEIQSCGEGSGSKFIWEQAKVIAVIQNDAGYQLADTIGIAHYSWLDGLPKNQHCIVYLVPYPLGNDEPFDLNKWILLEGDGGIGVDLIEDQL